MSRTVRALCLPALAALLLSVTASQGVAQRQLPPAPVPVVPAGPAEAVPPAPPPGPPRLPPPPPPPPYTPAPEYQNPFIVGDPLLDPSGTGPGWFGAVEIGLLKPHVNGRLAAVVGFGEFGEEVVSLPHADLDWTVAPRFELGYRLPEGFGEVLFSYRFLVSSGTDVLPDYDFLGDGVLHSRLDLNVFDFDYASRELSMGLWDMKWRIGARLANVFFDSRAEGLFLGQRTSNRFTGAGPHVGLDLWRRFADSGLALFGRVEGALTIGCIRQGFEETLLFDDGSMIGSARNVCETQAVPVLSFQVGLSWAPPHSRALRFSTGYQYEQWWAVGRAGDSRGDLWDHGVFFRGELGW